MQKNNMNYDNDYIRKEADDKLKGKFRKLFHQNNMKLKEHSASAGEDNGTDFYFDVTNEKEEHIFFFRNQNKGTFNDLPIIKNKDDVNFGKIYHTISLRNAINYYTEFDEAIIFTICDLNTNIIYWYDIQNDTTLKERIVKQQSDGINSIQIYISTENILNEESFEVFLKEINFSKINQIRKKKILGGNIEADYSKTKTDTEDKHVIDKIDYTLKLFEGIKVLPAKIIIQLYPFKGTENNTFINEFELYTDNEEFFDFMNGLCLKDDELEVESKEMFVENQKDKLRKIISFFQVNHIHHIRWKGKNPKLQICVHKLYRYGKCDCERCNLERLNLKRTNTLLNDDLKEGGNYETLRRGYTYYLLGDYKNSADIFLSVYNESDRSNNPIIYTISTYNLTRLKKLIKFNYYEDDRDTILEKLSSIDFDIDEPFINRNAPYFLDIYKGIKESRYFDDIEDEIENSFKEIQKLSFDDKFGGWISENGYYKLKSTFLRFTTYLEHNFIIFNQYSEFKNLSKKVLESIFALYTLKNPLTDKYEKFDWSILEMWIFSVDIGYSKYLLNKYNIKRIKIDDDYFKIIDKLNELIENLINSNEYINDFTNWFNPMRIDYILSKIVLITSFLDVEFKEKEKIILNIIHLGKMLEDKHIIPYDELVNFVEKNENEINKDLVKEIIDLFFFDEHKRFGFGRVLNIYSEKSSQLEIENLIKTVLKIENLEDIEINLDNRYLGKLLYSFTYLNEDLKIQIKNKIIEKLKENFDDKLYNLAVIYDIIDFDNEFFEKFISTIPDMSNVENNRHPFRSEENFRLTQTINLIFKYNIEIDNKLKSLVNKSHPNYFEYYSWLMDIDNYDYSKFNPYWILENQTVHYFERFKKSQKLKEELSKCLKENYIEGVAKIYIEELV
ncbi:DUF4365 domain-containing protein [Chryseobacterium sp. FH1]|uniref:DUF4365 domain-containing protein n=1 Tax=Chryseobacterium sp. FH1 TaxID=1233951 RepID=UPI0004E444A8|nr:DUF4365 domain-containing protein [Chryseobacterium sp. FH1]KFC19301.1 hypothetical protein IO90_08300 [Chryseobacterium sp. FH1]